MKLTGDLQIMSLLDILQWILHAKKTGWLRVEHKSVSRSIYCHEGRVVACASEDPSVLLGQFLLAHGRISEEVLREGLARQESTGKNLGSILVEIGALRDDQLLQIVTSKAMETIHGLFDWKQAGFTFEPDVEPAPGTIQVDLEVTEILFEGVRRMDEMSQIRDVFPSTEIVLARTDRPPDPTQVASVIANRIVECIDGERTLGQIILECRVSEFMACQLLLRLHQCGAIVVRELSPSAGGTDDALPDLERAEKLLASGDAFRAFRLLRALQDAEPGDAATKQLLSRAEAEFITQTYREGLLPDNIPIVAADAGAMSQDTLSSAERYVLSKIDGAQTVKRLMWTMPLRPVDALWVLKHLDDRKLIRIATPIASG